MRPSEGNNPLDLNNLPDDYSSRDNGKQILEDTSSPVAGGCRKKKSGGKDGKDECGKVYECRFCSLKFCKSQALGGHMNRHRQERETETLNQARQLVFRSDHNLAAQAAPHLGCCQPIGGGGYHPSGNMGDPTVPLRFPRYFSASTSTHIPAAPPPPPPPPPPPQPSQPYLYASPSRPVSFPTQFPHDYYVGHVLSSTTTHGHHNISNYAAAGGGADSGSYTCIGAPVGQAVGLGGGGNKDAGTVVLQEESAGLNWGRSYNNNSNNNSAGGSSSGGGGHHHHHNRLDPASAINRFQDGF